MSIRKSRSVLERTKLSAGSQHSSLMDELDLKEMEAYESENYCEAFNLQFSFLETKMASIIANFAKIAGIHSSTTKQLKSTWKVSDKISYFDCLVSPSISPTSKKDFGRLIEMLREYNTFRNDYLHDYSNPKKFMGASHIDYALQEAYSHGLEITRLLSKIKLKR
jgi:hypothetical protein